MKKAFIFTLFLSFISSAQDVPEEILQELNLNQSDVVNLLNSSESNMSGNEVNQEQVETLQPTKNGQTNSLKFGYDFFSKSAN